MKYIIFLFSILMVSVAPLFALAAGQQQIAYPHLTGWKDEPPKCGLKPAEAEWLEQNVAEGVLRVATKKDMQAWREKAEANGVENTTGLDCGRTFIILRPLTLRDEIDNYSIGFIVPKDVPFPQIFNSSPYYDMKTGGWFMLGQYENGVTQGIAKQFPRYDSPLYQSSPILYDFISSFYESIKFFTDP